MATSGGVRAGDVFVIPVEDEEVAVGQVLNVRLGAELLVAVMQGTCRRDEAMIVARSRAVVLMGLTMDALLHHGRWIVVGHSEPRRDVPMPTFKVAVAPGRFVEESLDGSKVRDVSRSEAERMPFRKVVAPIRIDKAAKALLGFEPWEPHYDGLLLGGT